MRFGNFVHFANLIRTTRLVYFIIITIIIIYPLTTRVVGAPQMIFQPLFSMFHCSPLPSGTCRTPSLSILSCCLPTSSSVCLVFFPVPFLLCYARWFWPDLTNERHVHTTAVCISLWWSGGLCGYTAWGGHCRKRIKMMENYKKKKQPHIIIIIIIYYHHTCSYVLQFIHVWCGFVMFFLSVCPAVGSYGRRN